MTTAMEDDLEQQTLLPPDLGTPSRKVLQELDRALTAQGHMTHPARLIGPDGTETELPVEVYTALRAAVHALSAGRGITLAPHTATLSTQQAADLLNISRPTLVKLLEDGEIPYEQSGRRRHRRVSLADVEGYRQRARRKRRAILDQLTEEADGLGLYDEENVQRR